MELLLVPLLVFRRVNMRVKWGPVYDFDKEVAGQILAIGNI